MSARRSVFLFLFATAISYSGISAQAQQDRITARVDATRTVVIHGTLHPKARPENDQGPVAGSLPMSVTLVLKPSAAQQQALNEFLAEQQDPTSPNYHHWLTPEQYADRFGVSTADLSKISAWLKSQGFSIGYAARARNFIVFNGTAAQVQNALHTEIHQYQVDGEPHYANATEPSVPAAIAPLVGGFQGLDDFRLKPNVTGSRVTPVSPDLTVSGLHFLAPDDFATIYDVAPLYAHGTNGAGQKIVVAGQTDISLPDIQSFQGMFNLPSNAPQVVLVPCSFYSNNSGCTSDPGTSNNDLPEADLDLEWSLAVARNATVMYVNSPNVIVSVQWAIDQALAPVITLSYGSCETGLSAGTASAFELLAQQANSEGITWLSSSGDSGAAGCDAHGSSSHSQATLGLATQLPASIPEVTAVGGTQFNEGNGTYWNASNSANGGSALSYIPEIGWNESSAQTGLNSTGGGVSSLYPKPAWQSGLAALTTNQRGVPDLALTAAGHDGYVVVTSAIQGCSGPGSFCAFGGTSASTPAFAGLVTLLNQTQASPGLGNINPKLYTLQNSAGVFHDITTGNNIVPCQTGTPNCTTGTFGYNAGVGYDLVTGLGSVDAANLFSAWNGGGGGGGGGTATATTVSANPTSISTSGTTVLTATVTAGSGTTTPSGLVRFSISGGSGITIGTANLSGSGTTATARITVYSGVLHVGSNNVNATYLGNSTFSQSSGSISVTATAPTAAVVIASITPTPAYQSSTGCGGAPACWLITVALTEVAGVNATVTQFTVNGSANLVSFFTSPSIPAQGSIATSLVGTGFTVPATQVFSLSGTDANGHNWTQSVTLPLLGTQGSAASYYFAHIATQSNWRTTFTYVNASPQSVTCTTYFFSNTGLPLSLTFSGQTVTSTVDTIPAGGVARRQTDAAANQNSAEVDGWARADCTGPVKASALFRSYNGATPTGEASVIASTAPATTFVSYADQNTGIAWANPSGATALLQFSAMDASGNVVASNSISLPPGYHSAANMGPLLNPPGINGSVKITSSQPILAITLNFEAAPVFSSLPPAQIDSSTPTGAASYYFAHIATQSNWRTTFTYVSLSTQSVTCQTSFFGNSGAPLSLSFNGSSMTSTSDTIAAGGTARRQTDAAANQNSAEVDGWAVASCSGPVKASSLFREYNGATPLGEASVIASNAPATTFVTYSDQNTGVAWANSSNSSATLTFTAKSATGSTLGSTSIQVPANTHNAANIGPLLNLSNFQGSITVSSTQAIISLSLNFEAPPGFSSLPPGN